MLLRVVVDNTHCAAVHKTTVEKFFTESRESSQFGLIYRIKRELE